MEIAQFPRGNSIIPRDCRNFGSLIDRDYARGYLHELRGRWKIKGAAILPKNHHRRANRIFGWTLGGEFPVRTQACAYRDSLWQSWQNVEHKSRWRMSRRFSFDVG